MKCFVIASAIEQMAAAEGSPLLAGSLSFSYIEGRGYGGGASVSASAMAAAPSVSAAPPVADENTLEGAIAFPGVVTINLDPKALIALIEAALRRNGFDPVYVYTSYVDEGQTSAKATVKGLPGASSEIALSPSKLAEVLTNELTNQGYSVAADGFRFSYRASGFGGPGGTSVTVSLTALSLS